MGAETFIPLAAPLAPGWRLIALDQPGHGYTTHAAGYTRKHYLADLSALFDHLRINEAVILGHSLGGVNAYQFAALYPQFVRGLSSKISVPRSRSIRHSARFSLLLDPSGVDIDPCALQSGEGDCSDSLRCESRVSLSERTNSVGRNIKYRQPLYDFQPVISPQVGVRTLPVP